MTERVFAGAAALFSISPHSFRLVSVGPEHAWGDLARVALRRLGLQTLARRWEERFLRRCWSEAAAAVQRVRQVGSGVPPRP